MIRIVVGIGAQLQNLIVASALALNTKPSRGVPDNRVEPIETADRLKQNLENAVIAFHVREFVCQYEAPAAERPFPGCVGKQDDGPENPPGHRWNRLLRNAQRYRPLQ